MLKVEMGLLWMWERGGGGGGGGRKCKQTSN